MTSPLQIAAWKTPPSARSFNLLLALGLVVMYVPTLVDLFRGAWSEDNNMHGPIVLCTAGWLLYRQWPAMLAAGHGTAPSALGWPVFVIGLLLYIVGRSQGILLFEVGSFIWLLAATILLQHGNDALRMQWFPLAFMLFMVPLPSTFVDTVTLPMKTLVSVVAENLLFWAGYPVARVGVLLHVGQYQLLVADACAGLHTLFTLEAMGLLYLNLVRRPNLFRNVALALTIIPISFTANVIRVIVLVLITYHFGDAAGQGFLHSFAGMLLFLTALALIMCVDSLLHLGLRWYRGRAPQEAA